jgi:tRNA(fMet)-specific endonuclease VapC
LALILADTDVLIDYLNGVEPVTGQVTRYIEDGRLRTTVITFFELLSGAGKGKRGDSVRKFAAALDVITLERNAAERAAAVRRGLEGAGQTIGMADSLIAGIAMEQDLPLLTRNRKHFTRVPGLRLLEVAQSES